MIYDFSKRPYMDQVMRVSFLQRVILIHSILYYMMDNPIISDKDFDEVSKQLVDETRWMPDDQKVKTDYWYCMHDFDGNTGFHLPYLLNEEDKKRLEDIINAMFRSRRN